MNTRSFSLDLTAAANASGVTADMPVPYDGWLSDLEIELPATAGVLEVAILVNGETVAPSGGTRDGYRRTGSGTIEAFVRVWVHRGDMITLRATNQSQSTSFDVHISFSITAGTEEEVAASKRGGGKSPSGAHGPFLDFLQE